MYIWSVSPELRRNLQHATIPDTEQTAKMSPWILGGYLRAKIIIPNPELRTILVDFQKQPVARMKGDLVWALEAAKEARYDSECLYYKPENFNMNVLTVLSACSMPLPAANKAFTVRTMSHALSLGCTWAFSVLIV